MSASPQRRSSDYSNTLLQDRDLERSPELYLKETIETCSSGIVVLNELGTVLHVNKGWRRFAIEHGYLIDGYGLGLNYLELRRKASDGSIDEAALAEGIQQVLLGKESNFHREYYSRNSHARRWVRLHAIHCDLPSACRVVIIHYDDTAVRRKGAERKDEQQLGLLLQPSSLLCQRAQIHGDSIDLAGKQNEDALREVTVRLINAQEDERRRVARELHDDLNQRMALLSIELEQIGQEIKTPMKVHRRLEDLQIQAREISTDIHHISYRLHPSKLDHLGLAAALKSLCQEISAKTTIAINFHHEESPVVLPKDVTLCLFRIAQEALRNCVKHSRACSAKVTLRKSESEVHLSISDDGCGFDMASGLKQKGLGFTSMSERLRIVDGVMQVRSGRMKGTSIEISVPLKLIS